MRDRGGLEDRIFRIESRDSYASMPLDRTVHVVGNVLVENVDGDEITAVANCLIHSYGKKGAQTLRGGLTLAPRARLPERSAFA